MATLANTFKKWKKMEFWTTSLRLGGTSSGVLLEDGGGSNAVKIGGVTFSATELGFLDGVTAGTVTASKAPVVGTAKQVDTLAVANPVVGVSATPGAAAQALTALVKKTGIADNTATSLITVTVPNANHAAAIRLTLLATCAVGTDAFESSRVATGTCVLARTTGANVVAAVSTIAQAQIATVSGGGTITLAYGVSAVSGAVGAVNTFDIQVTIVHTGTITSHQAVVLAELINAEATGVTMAASA